MNILEALFVPNNMQGQIMLKREGDAFQGSFRDLLEGGREDAKQSALHVAAITPQIGSAALRFEDRGLVGAAALSLETPAIVPAPTALSPAPSEEALAQPPAASTITASDPGEFVQQLGKALDLATNAGQPHQPPASLHSAQAPEASPPMPVASLANGANMAQTPAGSNNAADARGEKRVAAPIARPAPVAGQTQQTAIAPSGPIRSEATAPRAMQAPAPAQPAQQQPGSASQLTPYSALLVPQGEGMRLIIRVPNLTADELGRLEERIARLFAKRGMAAPETVIHQPALGGAEGNS